MGGSKMGYFRFFNHIPDAASRCPYHLEPRSLAHLAGGLGPNNRSAQSFLISPTPGALGSPKRDPQADFRYFAIFRSDLLGDGNS